MPLCERSSLYVDSQKIRKKTKAKAIKELTNKQKPGTKRSQLRYEETLQMADYQLLELEDKSEIFIIRYKKKLPPFKMRMKRFFVRLPVDRPSMNIF